MDRPANIAWYEGAALVFASATGRKIPSLWRQRRCFGKRRQEAKQEAFIQHQRHTRKDDEECLMCVDGFNSLGSPNIFRGHRYREWMPEVSESYKFYVQRMKEGSPEHPDPTRLSLEKNYLLSQVYYKYASDCGHFPESYRVLKALCERHIEGKHVPFHRYVITTEEREEIERDKKLPFYSRAFIQDARRSKCINMLSNIRNPTSSCLF